MGGSGSIVCLSVSWSHFYPLHCLLLPQEQTKVLPLIHIYLWIRLCGVASLSHIYFNKCQFLHLGLFFLELYLLCAGPQGEFPSSKFWIRYKQNTLLVVLHWHNWDRLEHLKRVLWILRYKNKKINRKYKEHKCSPVFEEEVLMPVIAGFLLESQMLV